MIGFHRVRDRYLLTWFSSTCKYMIHGYGGISEILIVNLVVLGVAEDFGLVVWGLACDVCCSCLGTFVRGN